MTFQVGREDSSLLQWLNEVGQVVLSAHNVERILTSIGTGAPTSPLSLFSWPGTNPLTWVPTAKFLPLVMSPLCHPFPLCYQGEFSAAIMPQFSAGSLLPEEEMCHCGPIHLSPVSWCLPHTHSHVSELVAIHPTHQTNILCVCKKPEEKEQVEDGGEGKMAEGSDPRVDES